MIERLIGFPGFAEALAAIVFLTGVALAFA
jgi:hypothetical protein